MLDNNKDHSFKKRQRSIMLDNDKDHSVRQRQISQCYTYNDKDHHCVRQRQCNNSRHHIENRDVKTSNHSDTVVPFIL